MEGQKTFVLCDSAKVNSYGFSFDLLGMDLERFKNNPVMLYGHDSDSVVGRWENIRVEGGKLMADAVFDLEDEKGAKVAGKVERGFLRGCSMGVYVRKMIDSVAVESELIEASIVSVPSDSGALVLYDENRKKLSVEEAQLKYNINENNQKMDSNEKTNFDSEVAELQMKLTECSAELEASKIEKAEMAERIEKLEAAIAERDNAAIELYLQNAVKDGQINEKEREGFAKLAASDFETVKSIIDSREKKASMSLRDMQSYCVTSTNELAAKSWDELDRENKLADLKMQDPEMYEKKFNEKFKK